MFNRKKEANDVYGLKGNGRDNRNQYVVVVLISNPAPTQHEQGNQRRSDEPRRQFTKINMLLSQALQHLLKAELITMPIEVPNFPIDDQELTKQILLLKAMNLKLGFQF